MIISYTPVMHEFDNLTDGVEYTFKTDDSSESNNVWYHDNNYVNYSYDISQIHCYRKSYFSIIYLKSLVLNWQPPDSPSGDILNYFVRITLHSDEMRISEQNVIMTLFTATLASFSESHIFLAIIITIYSYSQFFQVQEFPTMSALHQWIQKHQ